MCKYRVNHLVELNFYSDSISKILVTEFNTMKLSQNFNLMYSHRVDFNQQRAINEVIL